MTNYKNGKWATQIVGLQHEDGTWGRNFHSLGQPTSENPLTTEQALRRLMILGFTLEDEPIRKAVDCMTACLRGARKIDDYSEKKHDWEWFTKRMLSAWVKIFDPESEIALDFAQQWAYIAETAFSEGEHNKDLHAKAFTEQFGRKPSPQSSFEHEFGTLYDAYLLQGVLTPKTECCLLDYYISKKDGIYYAGSGALNKLPEAFSSRKTSLYLAGVEAIAGYDLANKKLGFVVDWLNKNKDENNQWDLSSKANDGIYLPLSDSWQKAEDRKFDCTARINLLLSKIAD